MVETRTRQKPPQTLEGVRWIEVRLPLPDRDLCGNGTGRNNGFRRARLVKAQRGAAKLAAREARKSYDAESLALHGTVGDVIWPMGRVRVDVHIRRAAFWSARRLDDDNLIRGLKGAIDGLADAQVFSDDRQVRWGAITWETAKPGEHGVTLTLAHVEGSHWSWIDGA